VLATGVNHSVREFIEMAFGHVDTKVRWEGKGLDEKGIDAANGKVLVSVDPRYFRPTEVDFLLGDPAKAKKVLGWTHTVELKDLVAEMVDCDLKSITSKRGRSDD
jgi:GDPmannose 4,6-dehydratase